MKAFGSGALEALATLWMLFGGLGLLMTLASLVHPENAYPGWQWTIVVSAGLVLGGMGILRRHRGARWIAAAAVAGGLAEASVWLWWMWTPILIATAVFHAYGLVVLILTEFSRSHRKSGGRPVSGHRDSRLFTSKEAAQ